ncbi:hypothetical protein NDU88_001381 [Pleurodeles waltl]|uniref:Uncharacterized protein n=1 Tax=Pleurodeles waltl TaxID=8319 RepID=A0AAV7R8X6_PLEWA|nr:hypothetical protein NDU88_001381 [Pleurodeles waltl]
MSRSIFGASRPYKVTCPVPGCIVCGNGAVNSKYDVLAVESLVDSWTRDRRDPDDVVEEKGALKRGGISGRSAKYGCVMDGRADVTKGINGEARAMEGEAPINRTVVDDDFGLFFDARGTSEDTLLDLSTCLMDIFDAFVWVVPLT